MKKQTIFPFLIIAFTVSFSAQPAFAGFDWLKKKLNAVTTGSVESIKETTLNETEISEGFKEALKIGIENAVKSASKPGGYLDNEAIKITMPQSLQFLDKSLRKIGFGDKIDDFVLSMNSAAELASASAQNIFTSAILDMSFDDAKMLLQGQDTAVTDYFKDKTYSKLADAFRPTVDTALEKYDVTNKYNELISKYQSIPFVSKVSMLSPDEYVINKTLDGLFYVLGQEEAKIRQDPAARVTDILEKVFKQ
ncbi:MAG: DUF4197 domain-containing protein [Candidatus Omnitrophica bacterium]|nr:DUF4197 domain-containing protein [Candidatus Omnitrophota bacterium]MBU1996410.1 DUF4197 domain-containing protein [Candidatus Omnitrophota bacterium]